MSTRHLENGAPLGSRNGVILMEALLCRACAVMWQIWSYLDAVYTPRCL